MNTSEPNKIVGQSEAIKNVLKQIKRSAAHDIPLLLLGETGTGKDLVAQEIHKKGKRKEGLYLPINLGALPSQLVASELFGHEKGAFTGAVERHIGAFERANNGTVFLDEIDTLDEKTQVSLLRLIEQKKFLRLGGKKTINTNARLMAASNQNLERLVDKGLFRKDLFYRLDVFRINLPPLREHSEDVVPLSNSFLKFYNKKFNKKISGFSDESLEVLVNYDWPGNVRELKNVVQRAVLVCESTIIEPKHFPQRIHKMKKGKMFLKFEVGTPLHMVEKEMVKKALAVSNENRTKAAELLGITRRAIYNKFKKHNLD